MQNPQDEYERWVAPILDRMMRTVWRIVRDPDDAQDAFQLAMESIWKQWPRVRRHPNPPALMMTICVNTAYNHVRQRARRARREVSDERLENHSSPRPTPDQQMAASELLAAIHASIGALPPMQRAAVSLRLLADLSFDAIAQALNCSEVTARTNFMRALQKLRVPLARFRPAAKEETP